MTDIPVNVNDAVVVVTATADAQTSFAFDFLAFEQEHVKVIFTPVSGSEQTLTVGTNYSVTGLSVANGGSITMITDLSIVTGDKMVIYRSVPIERLADYQQAGDFLAETINAELDRMVMMIQDNRRDIDRTPQVPLGQDGFSIARLAEGHFWITDANGNAIDGGDGSDIQNAAANATQAAADAVTATQAAALAVAASGVMRLPNRSDFATNDIFSYTAADGKIVVAVGDTIWLDDLPYSVVSAVETAIQLTNAEGVKIKAKPTEAGWYRMEQFGVGHTSSGAENVDGLHELNVAFGLGLSDEAHYYGGGVVSLASTVTMTATDVTLYSGKGARWQHVDGTTSGIILGQGGKLWGFRFQETTTDPWNGIFVGTGVDHATVWVPETGCEIIGCEWDGITYMGLGTDDAEIVMHDVRFNGQHDGVNFENTDDGTRTGTDTPTSVNLPGAVWVNVASDSGQSIITNVICEGVVEGLQFGNYGSGVAAGVIITDGIFRNMGDHAVYDNSTSGEGLISVSNLHCVDCRIAIAVTQAASVIGCSIIATDADPNRLLSEAGIQLRDPNKVICANNVIEGVGAAITLDTNLSSFLGVMHDVLVCGNMIDSTAESIRTGSGNSAIRVNNGHVTSASTLFGKIRICDNDIDAVSSFLEANLADTDITMVSNVFGLIDIRGRVDGGSTYECKNITIDNNRINNRGASASIYVLDCIGVRCRNNEMTREYAPTSAFTGYEAFFKNVDGLVACDNFYQTGLAAPNLTIRGIHTDNCSGYCADEKMDYTTFPPGTALYYSMSANMNKSRICCDIYSPMTDTFTIASGASTTGAITNKNVQVDSLILLSTNDINSSALFTDNGPYPVESAGSLTINCGGTAAATSVGVYHIT